MINRITAFSFILLANILLVARAVIPHHHHHNEDCFHSALCLYNGFTEDMDSDLNNQCHDVENDPDVCVLKEPVAVLTDQWKIDLKTDHFISSHLDFNKFVDNLHNNRTKVLISELTLIIFADCYNCSYFSLVFSSSGLRAPPAA